MGLAVCGICQGVGREVWRPGPCRECAGRGYVDDGGLIADLTKQRLEDAADERREWFGDDAEF